MIAALTRQSGHLLEMHSNRSCWTPSVRHGILGRSEQTPTSPYHTRKAGSGLDARDRLPLAQGEEPRHLAEPLGVGIRPPASGGSR